MQRQQQHIGCTNLAICLIVLQGSALVIKKNLHLSTTRAHAPETPVQSRRGQFSNNCLVWNLRILLDISDNFALQSFWNLSLLSQFVSCTAVLDTETFRNGNIASPFKMSIHHLLSQVYHYFVLLLEKKYFYQCRVLKMVTSSPNVELIHSWKSYPTRPKPNQNCLR